MTYEQAKKKWLEEKRMAQYPNACCHCDNGCVGIVEFILFLFTMGMTIIWGILTHAPLFFFNGTLVAAIFGQIYTTSIFLAWYPALGLLLATAILWFTWNFAL